MNHLRAICLLLVIGVSVLLGGCVTRGVHGAANAVNRRAIRVDVQAAPTSVVLVPSVPVRIAIDDERGSLPSRSTIGLAPALIAGSAYQSQQSPVEIVRQSVERTLGNMGLRINPAAAEAVGCRIRLKRFWVERPMHITGQTRAQTTLEIVIQSPDGETIWQRTVDGNASAGLQNSALPHPGYVLAQSLASAMRQLATSDLVATARGYEPYLTLARAGNRPTAPVVNRPPVPMPTALGPVAQCKAVVIGISKYANKGQWGLSDLRHASADAKAMEALLKSDRGGFDEVEMLLDEDATAVAVKQALRENLRGVQPNDLVLIFWAGHGFPDPHETEKLYLITHDTDPEHMASTAYSMEEFRRDVAAIKAGRVIVVADACHSGGIFDPTIGIRGQRKNTIVSSLRGVYVGEEAAKHTGGPSRVIFTSSEQGQVSQESEKLGHGVFTYYMLDALKGEADKPQNKTGGNGDGKVTLGELIEYTRDRVRRFTGNQQHPSTAGRFDRELVLSQTK
jgi:uncharacterized caspase-like protein